MSVAALKALLEQRHGMRFDELTENRLARALEAVAGAGGGAPDAGAARVMADPRLQRELVDRVTLQETSFFRDPLVWDDLATHVLPEAIRAAQGGPLVVWSAGCANGQEAWSMAMLLTELGAARFEVVASDLSERAVERTRAGSYADRELRGLDAARRDRFMVADGGRWRVSEGLRRHVRVVHQNAATDPVPVGPGACSVVLCRYLMIYLTPGAADDLLARVAGALTPDGRLVIGAAESLWHLSARFSAIALPHAVAYARRRDGAPRAAGRRPGGRVAAPVQPLPEGGRLRLGVSGAGRPAERRTAPTTSRADTGARTPASGEAPDAPALRRRGEQAAAQGDMPAAAAAFRGAAYVDPDDASALTQLGLVLDAMGDPGARRAYRAARAAIDRLGQGAVEPALVQLLAGKLGEPA